jgi:hypothetical protein
MLVSSRLVLARGSVTPEGEIKLRNISGVPVKDLVLSIVFYDSTARRRLGLVSVAPASPTHPLEPGASTSAYFSCPNVVKPEHQLSVIIYWQGRFFKELPVVKER